MRALLLAMTAVCAATWQCEAARGAPPPRLNATRLSAALCATGLPVAVPAVQWRDGVCDCCDGSDELPAIASCPNTCAQATQEAESALADFIARQERGMARYLQRKASPAADAHVRVKLQRDANAARTTAMTVLQHKSETQHKLRKLYASGEPVPPSILQTYQHLEQQATHVYEASQAAVRRARLGDALSGPWLALLDAECAFAPPVTEKLSKGGSVTSVPKQYLYSVCFGANVTQAHFLPDEWQRQEDGTPGTATTTQLDADGGSRVLPAAAANRTWGPATVLGMWEGFARPSHPTKVFTTLPANTTLDELVMVYATQDTCISGSMRTTRRVHVAHVCAGMAAHTLSAVHRLRVQRRADAGNATAFIGRAGKQTRNMTLPLPPLHSAWPLVTATQLSRWNAAGREDGISMMPPGMGTPYGDVVHVEEDGLCQYRLVVSTHLACKRRDLAEARALSAWLRARAAAPLPVPEQV